MLPQLLCLEGGLPRQLFKEQLKKEPCMLLRTPSACLRHESDPEVDICPLI